MTNRLQWKIDQAEEGLSRVRLIGSVDEDADFAALVGEINQRSHLKFDLSDIARINSCGVREWVNFMRSLPDQSTVELEKCSAVVVSQINMISNFVGGASINSVFAPYVCDACGHEESVLLEVKKGEIPTVGERECPTCADVMVFDDIEDSYFAFLV